MRHLLFFLLAYFSLYASFSQEVTVKNLETKEPLFNVTIFNFSKTKSTLTDFDGKAALSNFSENEKITFSHVAFLTATFSKKEILQHGSEVFLKPNPNQLEEIVLSVSKFQQDKKKIPQKVVALSRKDVKFYNPQTSADLLETSGQIYVQKSQLGGGSPMIRGFATNRLLITVNGVRMNNAIFRGGNLQNIISIDPLALEATEVILGPGPVVYGSDAVGGVMNFYTLDAKLSVSDKTKFSGNFFSRYATANKEKTGHIDFGFGNKKWASATSISYSDFGDLKMGSHGPDEYLREFYVVQQNGTDLVKENTNPRIQKTTGYNQINLLQKLKFVPNNNWEFGLGVYYSTTSDYNRYDRLIQIRNGQPRSAEWYYGPQSWLFSNFEIKNSGAISFYDTFKINLAYQNFEESRHNRSFGSTELFSNKERVNAYSANLDFEKQLNSHKLFYGLEYVHNTVFSEGNQLNTVDNSSQIAPSRYPDNSSWQSAAAYISNQWELSPVLHLQTGARYSHVYLDAEFSNGFYDFPFSKAKISNGAFTGNAGLSWLPTDFLIWKINFASAFRSPNIDDVGKIFDSEPGAVVVPNPNLKAEHAYNAEIGMQFNFENIFQLDLASYYTILNDVMVRRPYQFNGQTTIEYQGEQSQVLAIQNAAKANAYGFEAGARFFIIKNLELNTKMAITKGDEEQEDGTTAPLRHASPFFGNTHLLWKKGKIKLDLFAEYNGKLKSNELSPSEQSKAYLYVLNDHGEPYYPSWYTLNCAAMFKITENLQATATFENITDQRYRTYSSGIAAAGRNFILAINYRF